MHSSSQDWIKRRHSLIADVFEINLKSKLNNNIDYSKVNLFETDTFYQEMKWFFKAMKILSLFPISVNEKTGQYSISSTLKKGHNIYFKNLGLKKINKQLNK